jgi:hypothetical protein
MRQTSMRKLPSTFELEQNGHRKPFRVILRRVDGECVKVITDADGQIVRTEPIDHAIAESVVVWSSDKCNAA